jgi:FkbM family methyltransferase
MNAISRTAGHVVDSLINGKRVKFFVQNQNDHIQQEHYNGRFYEPEELQIIAKFFRSGDVFVDFGANCGNHLLFVHHFFSSKLIIPFEVNPVALKILNINLKLNDCHNVDLQYLGIGISDKDGRLSIEFSPDDNLGGTSFREDPNGPFTTIAGDLVLSQRPVDFIKIDLEGMEIETLRGIAQTIARWRPRIFIEIRDENIQTAKEIMASLRYRIVETFTRYGGLSNYMFVPNEQTT